MTSQVVNVIEHQTWRTSLLPCLLFGFMSRAALVEGRDWSETSDARVGRGTGIVMGQSREVVVDVDLELICHPQGNPRTLSR